MPPKTDAIPPDMQDEEGNLVIDREYENVEPDPEDEDEENEDGAS